MNMKNTRQLRSKIIIGCLIALFAVAGYAQIEVRTADDLDNVRRNPNEHYVQVADIDLTRVPNWEPIGNPNIPFTGIYDGNGYKITNMTINREREEYIGLFGAVQGERALIKNLGLENVDVTGEQFIGGLVGIIYSQANIRNCYVSGEVSGQAHLGLLVGFLGRGEGHEATVSDSYAAGGVNTDLDGGGLIGASQAGTVTNSYSSAVVEGGSDELMGGLIGFRGEGGRVEASFWDTEISGMNDSQGGTGLPTAEMLSENTYRGWDFRETWSIAEGETYPYFQWQREPGDHNYPQLGSPTELTAVPGDGYIDLFWQAPSTGDYIAHKIYRDDQLLLRIDEEVTQYRDEEVVNYTEYRYYVTAVWEDETESRPSNEIQATPHDPFAGGDGSEENPYQLATAQHLNDIRYQLTAHYILVDDINIGVPPWNEGEGWETIGYWFNDYDNVPFSGSINGNGFVINGLTISRPDDNYVGFFACLDNAYLNNITFENVDVQGEEHVCTIAPRIIGETNITGINVSGDVQGDTHVAGIFGYVSGGDITDCHFNGSITATGNNVGGLLYHTDAGAGVISDCIVEAVITSEGNRVGGITSRTFSPIKNCVFRGEISGNIDVGGIAGQNRSTISACYASGELRSTGAYSGGIVGRNYAVLSHCYADMDIAGDTVIGGIAGSHGQLTAQDNVLMIDCYNKGTVTVIDGGQGDIMGGLAGRIYDEVQNCFAFSRVDEGNEHVGGLIGRVMHDRAVVTNSYWDIDVSGQQQSAAGEGRSTQEMTYPYAANTYVEWDFDEIWEEDADYRVNRGYPYLFWQYVPPVIEAPEVSADIITQEGVDYILLSWNPVENADIYKVYAVDEPGAEDWGEPIAVVDETGYQEPVSDESEKRFYKVIAAAE